MPAPTARVHVLTRRQCCLCDEALDVARAVCGELGVALRMTDVDSDPALRAEWNDHVPVTFVDGERFAMWTLDGAALRRALVGS